MKYKLCNARNRPVVAVIGCVLAAAIVCGNSRVAATEANVAASVSSSNEKKPTALSIQPRACCRGSNIVSGSSGNCLNRTEERPAGHKFGLNCTQFYIVEQEEDVHVNEQGALVEGDYETDWDDYCATMMQLGDGTLQPIFEVCFKSEEITSHPGLYMSKAIMMLISVFFLAVTLYIYFIIPDLRETQDKVTSIAVSCLLMFMLLLSLVQLQISLIEEVLCEIIAFLMYFFLISYFAWLNIIMANVWKLTVARRWKIKEKAWYILNHIYANTVALTLTAMVYVYHMRHPTLGEGSCWFRTEREQSYFVYLPLSVMLSINIFLFVWTSYHLHASGDDISPDRKKALRYKCMLYLKLFLLAGLIWIFEILSFHVGDGPTHQSWFWVLIDSINCLHGVLIFFVLIVWRQRIKRELSGRRILCFRAPASWSQLKDDEQEQLAENDREYGKYDLIIK